MAAITTLANTSNTKYAEVVNDSDAAATGINPEHLKTLIHNIFIKVDEALAKTNTHTNDFKTQEQIEDIVGAMFDGGAETRISATYDDTNGKINLVVDDMSGDNNTTYAISVENGDNTDEEKIRITASTGGTDDIVLEAGTGLTIARSGDKITFTNTVTDTTYTVGDGGLTQNNFTDTLKNKLDGIASGAEQNVQSDWNSSSGDNQILNKPTIPVDLTSDGAGTVHPNNYTNTTYSVGDGGLTQNNFTNADHTKLNGIENNATADQTQSDINALGITEVGTITSGVWTGTAIADANIASASTWNGKQNQLTFGIADTNSVVVDGGTNAPVDSDVAMWTTTGLQGYNSAQFKTAFSIQSLLTFGIGNTNVAKCGAGIVDDDFIRVNGTTFEGRSASEVLSDIGGQASLTFGISNDNAVEIDSSTVAEDDYARFTADGLDGVNASELLSDIGAAALAGSSSQDFATRTLTANNHILAKTVVYFDAETANTIGNGATGAIDWTHNQKQKLTITGTGITCNFTNPPGPCNLMLKVIQGDGSDVISTWDSDIKWPNNGTAPTLSTGNGDIDILSFYFDGTNYFGVASLDFA